MLFARYDPKTQRGAGKKTSKLFHKKGKKSSINK